MAIMTNKEFIAKLQHIVDSYKTVYMWGVFGAPVTESLISAKAKQYPDWYTSERQASFRKLIGQGYFGFDCVNLIKGILWGWNGDMTATYGGAKYASNGVPDTNADGMIKLCNDISTDFNNILPGEALWVPGHIGVYIGDGLAIECTPRWSNNVQVTAVGNIGKKAGYNIRTWHQHGKLPFIDYVEDKPEPEKTEPALDNTPDAYAVKAVGWAIDNKLIVGDGRGDYMLHQNITRQDMLVILERFYNFIKSGK